MYFKQIDEIVNGTKTQTRRICKLGEYDLVAPEEKDYMFLDREGNPCIFHLATETRRITAVRDANKRLKWEVGRDYAVSPGRGKAGVWWKPDTDEWRSRDDGGGHPYYDEWCNDEDGNTEKTLRENGYTPLRIRLLEIRREPLQNISEADATAEGCDAVCCPECGGHGWGTGTGMMEDPNQPGEPIPYQIQVECSTCAGHGWMETPAEAYRDLWDTINTRKGTRWDNNPDVWVLTFEVVQ